VGVVGVGVGVGVVLGVGVSVGVSVGVVVGAQEEGPENEEGDSQGEDGLKTGFEGALAALGGFPLLPPRDSKAPLNLIPEFQIEVPRSRGCWCSLGSGQGSPSSEQGVLGDGCHVSESGASAGARERVRLCWWAP